MVTINAPAGNVAIASIDSATFVRPVARTVVTHEGIQVALGDKLPGPITLTISASITDLGSGTWWTDLAALQTAARTATSVDVDGTVYTVMGLRSASLPYRTTGLNLTFSWYVQETGAAMPVGTVTYPPDPPIGDVYPDTNFHELTSDNVDLVFPGFEPPTFRAVTFAGSGTDADSLSLAPHADTVAGDSLLGVVTWVREAGHTPVIDGSNYTTLFTEAGSHWRAYVLREATDDSSDILSTSASPTGGNNAVCITLVTVQGGTFAAWQYDSAEVVDSVGPNFGPDSGASSDIDVSPGTGLLVTLYSQQNNSGTKGVASDHTAVDGTNVGSAYGERDTFRGAANTASYKEAVTGSQNMRLTMDSGGGEEYSTSLGHFSFWNTGSV